MHISLHGGKGSLIYPSSPTRWRRSAGSGGSALSGVYLDSTIVASRSDNQRSFRPTTSGACQNGYNIAAFWLRPAGWPICWSHRQFLSELWKSVPLRPGCAPKCRRQLVAFRVLQGIPGRDPPVLPLAVVEGFDAARHARYRPVGCGGSDRAAGLGPPIGEALMEWRWVLLVNVPLGIVAAIATKHARREPRLR